MMPVLAEIVHRCSRWLVLRWHSSWCAHVSVRRADAWSEMERDAGGLLQANKQRFPSGMKALGDYIHSKGATVLPC